MSVQIKKKDPSEESPAAPDSTTKEKSGFSEGEDVLLQHKDGRYYLGTIVEVELSTEKCLVKFGDNTESWSSFKDLTKLSLPDSNILCVICKKSTPKTDNEIIVCDKCGRGYHQLCHQPHISKDCTEPDAHWICKRCLENMPVKTRESKLARKETARKMCGLSGLTRQDVSGSLLEKNKLPYDIQDASLDERRENILSVLTNNKNRFKCGREIKKRTTIWGLRVRVPPPAPTYTLPSVRPVNDAVLKERWVGNKRLKFLPPLSSRETSNSSEKLTNPNEIPNSLRNPVSVSQETPAGIKLLHINSHPDLVAKSCVKNSDLYSGKGFVKKSSSYNPANRYTLQQSLLRRRQKTLNSSTTQNHKDRLLRRRRHKQQCADSHAKTFTARKARKLLKNAIAKSQKSTQDAPQTPTTSALNSSQNVATSSTPLAAAATTATSRSTSSNVAPFFPPSTPGDTSGDETSSRGTLDSFIPPPKDFEGKNNPFRSLTELLSAPNGLNVTASLFNTTPPPSVLNTSPITLPLPLTAVLPLPVPPRPAKRQLSEKDIRIDRNGEVKRRRHRRNRANSANAGLTNSSSGTVSKNAMYVPGRLDVGVKTNDIWTNAATSVRSLRSMYSQGGTPSSSSSTSGGVNGSSAEYVSNGNRKLPQRHDSKASEKKTNTQPPPVKSSPVKQNPVEISIDDLKSSVNIYFGAANRIAAGEKFNVRAKRTTTSGKIQYLIEWDGPST